MEHRTVVTTDGHKLGTFVDERDAFVVLEGGHVFKTMHAVPREYLHEVEGELRATVTKDVVDASPKIDLEQWDAGPLRAYYGLDVPFEADQDADGLQNAETDGLRHGVKPAPAERLEVLEGKDANSTPAVHERQANAADPGGVTANLD